VRNIINVINHAGFMGGRIGPHGQCRPGLVRAPSKGVPAENIYTKKVKTDSQGQSDLGFV